MLRKRVTPIPTSFNLPTKMWIECGNHNVSTETWIPDLLPIRFEEVVNHWQPVPGTIPQDFQDWGVGWVFFDLGSSICCRLWYNSGFWINLYPPLFSLFNSKYTYNMIDEALFILPSILTVCYFLSAFVARAKCLRRFVWVWLRMSTRQAPWPLPSHNMWTLPKAVIHMEAYVAHEMNCAAKLTQEHAKSWREAEWCPEPPVWYTDRLGGSLTEGSMTRQTPSSIVLQAA